MTSNGESPTNLLQAFQHAGAISSVVAEQIAKYAQKWRCSVFHALLETNVFDEHSLSSLISSTLGVGRVFTPSPYPNSEHIRESISFYRAWDLECFVLGSKGPHDVMEVVFADPTNTQALQEVNTLWANCKTLVASRSEVLTAIAKHYSIQGLIPSLQSRG